MPGGHPTFDDYTRRPTRRKGLAKPPVPTFARFRRVSKPSLTQIAGLCYAAYLHLPSQTDRRVEGASAEEPGMDSAPRRDSRCEQLERELDSHRQKLLIVDSQLRSVVESRSWRRTRLLRALGGLFRPVVHEAGELIPYRDLEHADGTFGSRWRALGPNPLFLGPFPLPRGCAELHLKMQSATASSAELYFDWGKGWVRVDSFAAEDLAAGLDIRRHYYCPPGFRGVRLDPLHSQGTFVLEKFRLATVPTGRLLWQAMLNRRKEGASYRRLVGDLIKRFLRVLRRQLGAVHREICRDFLLPSEPSYFPFSPLSPEKQYADWRYNQRLTDADEAAMRSQAAALRDPPWISVLMPVGSTSAGFLREAIESVLHQTYPHWDLCIAADSSAQSEVRQVLDEYSGRDRRIKVANRQQTANRSEAASAALALAEGSHVVVLCPEDLLAKQALFRVAEVLVADPAADVIYSDEDAIDGAGQHREPRFKPDWSPEYLLACMYIGQLGAYRTSLVREVGGFRSEYGGAEDYDLVLRLTARTSQVRHIADVLYHRRKRSATTIGAEAERRAADAGRRALADHLEATGRPARVLSDPNHPFLYRTRLAIRGCPTVSIVIPSACRRRGKEGGSGWYITQCLESIRSRSSYRHYELIVVDNGDVEPDLERALAPYALRRITYSGPLNLAVKMNQGAACAEGEHLVFLNDDIEVISPDWLESLLEFSQCPEIGAVGAKLFFTNGNLQHAGVVMVQAGLVTHCFYNYPGDFAGRPDSTIVHRNYLGVTGACFMTRRDVFRDVGGYDERFALCYNDVDYCFRVIESGKRIVYQAHAQLSHHESASRERGVPRDEIDLINRVWFNRMPRDPYYNPNLSTDNDGGLPNPAAAKQGFNLVRTLAKAG